MRTTLAIDDDILVVAKSLATRQRKSIGEVVSVLLRQALQIQDNSKQTRNGVTLLPLRADALPVTPELVNQLRDESP